MNDEKCPMAGYRSWGIFYYNSERVYHCFFTIRNDIFSIVIGVVGITNLN